MFGAYVLLVVGEQEAEVQHSGVDPGVAGQRHQADAGVEIGSDVPQALPPSLPGKGAGAEGDEDGGADARVQPAAGQVQEQQGQCGHFFKAPLEGKPQFYGRLRK